MDTEIIPEPSGWEDPFTGLSGPDFWRHALISEIARGDRYDRALTVVVVELEGLVQTGHVWGIEVARSALREAAQCLRRASRASDHCVRIGAARFGVILTETDEIEAINFVERVREDAPRALPKAASGVRFTFGWASPAPGEAADVVVRRAERRLTAELLA